MKCPATLEKLPLFVGGDLELRQHAEVEAHLERCLSCYREFDSYRQVLERVRRTGESARAAAASDPDFTRAVMARIDGPPPLRRPSPLWLAGGWAAAFCLGIFLARLREGPAEPAAPVVAPLFTEPVSLEPVPRGGLRQVAPENLLLVDEDLVPPEEEATERPPLRTLPVSFPVHRVRDY